MKPFHTPLPWIFTMVAIAVIVAGILLTQPKGTENVPSGLENDGSPRVQTLEQMLMVGDNAIFVEDQRAGSREVVVGLAVMGEPGFVTVHRDDDGLPGAIIGSSMWIADGAEHFYVDVEEPLQNGSIYYAMIHKDDGDQEFDHNRDVPVTDAEGSIVLMTFSASDEAAPETGAVLP